MPLRDILVQLDSSPRTAERLALALQLARRGNARLDGIFVRRAAAYQVGVVAVWPPESYTHAADTSRELFERTVAGYENARWSDLNRGSDHEIPHHLTEAARHYDLTIVGQEKRTAPGLCPLAWLSTLSSRAAGRCS
jgi:nucleotide-binding universal stress UspA family protein